MAKPVTMHCVYRPKVGQEAALLELVRAHWQVLHAAGLTTDTPAQVYRATERHSDRPFYIEIYSWRDENSAGLAHQLPEVMKIWEPMGPMIDGGPSPQLAVLEPL